jgi:hypothetical protein
VFEPPVFAVICIVHCVEFVVTHVPITLAFTRPVLAVKSEASFAASDFSVGEMVSTLPLQLPPQPSPTEVLLTAIENWPDSGAAPAGVL